MEDGNERHDQAAAILAEQLVADATAATAALAKELKLRRRSREEANAFVELLAVRVAAAELAFEAEGAAFQRITGPALLRRHLGAELDKPARKGSPRRRLADAVGRRPIEDLHRLLDRRTGELRPLSSVPAVVDHHVRTLMSATRRSMADAPTSWMTLRGAEVLAVTAAQAAVADLLTEGWFDPDPL